MITVGLGGVVKLSSHATCVRFSLLLLIVGLVGEECGNASCGGPREEFRTGWVFKVSVPEERTPCLSPLSWYIRPESTMDA